MGEHTYSKPKVGQSIARAKQTSIKLLSVFLAIIMVTTVFSSIVIADDQGTDPVGDDSSTDADTTQRGKIGGIIKELINRIRENRKGIFSLGLVTRYQKDGSSDINETSTRMRLLLPTGIDIDGDGDNDIRVWVIRRPALDLSPPALAWKTSILVRRLSGMDEDMINDFFEVYLEYNPRVPSGLIQLLSEGDERFARIRLGYQSPADEEIPKYCIVSHKDIPHFIYPKQKNAHRVSINPGVIADNSQLNLLFSIADMKDDTVLSELNLQINHSPAVKSEFSIERSKDNFVRRGQTLEISRNNVNSNVSLYVKDIGPLDRGSLTVESLPKKITLGWKLARTGYVEISTEGSKTGAIKAKVDGAVDIGFKPETALNFRIDWKSPYLLGRLLQKGYDLEFSGSADVIISDFYVHAETIDWNMSKFSLNAGGEGGVYNLKLLKSQLDTVYVEAENVDVAIEDSVITLIPPEAPEKPTVSITSHEDGDTVEDIVSIEGTAKAPPGREIQAVTITIDDGEEIVATGTTSWSYDWDTTTLPNGDCTIVATCYDDEGYSATSKVTVTVDNIGANWRPLVSIDSPSNLQIVSGIVPIAGTATDLNPEDEVSVELVIYNNLTKYIERVDLTVDESGAWSYDWDTTELTAGLYEIIAESYDGKDYSLYPVASVLVWVRLKIDLTVSLLEASVNVTNFVIKTPSATINVSTFTGSGNGSLNIADDAVSADFSASLALNDFSLLMTNENELTQLSVENLSADLSGYGEVVFSGSGIGMEVNASVYLDFDSLYIAGIPIIGALDLGAFVFEGNGSISTGIDIVDENITIGGYGDKDEVTIEATDLKINITGAAGKYFEMGADQITMKGKGNLSTSENHKEIKGSLDEFTVDNLYVQSDLALLAFSGSINSMSEGKLVVKFTNLSNFNISYEGEKPLEVLNPKVTLRSDLGTIVAYADSVTTMSRNGFARFSYSKNDLGATCLVNWSEICFTGLYISYNELSVTAYDYVCGSGEFEFTLSTVIFIEYGDDWINITIDGGEMGHVVASAKLYDVNSHELIGNIDIDIEFDIGENIFIINISGLNDNVALYIDGNLSLDIDAFDLWIKDKLDTSIGKLSGNFTIHGEGGNWTLDTIHGVSGSNLYFSRYLYLLGGFFSIQLDSIDTSAGGRLEIEDKNITYTNLDDAYRTINLQGLDIIIDDLIYLIMEEIDLGLTGANTTVSVYLSGNETTIYADFNPGASVTINTLWAYIPDIAEIRLHSVNITAPTSINLTMEDSPVLTVDTGGIITIGELSILDLFSMGSRFSIYGAIINGSDVSVSINIPDDGGVGFETSGAVDLHIDVIVLKLRLLNLENHVHNPITDLNISFEGQGEIKLKGLSLDLLFIGAGPLHVECSVKKHTTVSFRVSAEIFEKFPIIESIIGKGAYITIDLEPGDYLVNLEYVKSYGEIGLFGIATDLCRIGFGYGSNENRFSSSISFKGYIECQVGGLDGELMGISISELEVAGFLKFARHELIGGDLIERYIALNGNGSGYLSMENKTDPSGGDPKLNVVGQWDEGYLTLIKSVELFDDTAAIMWMLHDIDFDIDIGPGMLLQFVLQVLIGDTMGIWVQKTDETWYRIFPPPWSEDPTFPPLNGIATLIHDDFSAASKEIIPGDTVDFAAYYVPANLSRITTSFQSLPGMESQQQSQQQQEPLGSGGSSDDGNYTFELDYGDGNSQIFVVNYSEDPIKVDLGIHQYTALGTYNVTLTVSDDPDADGNAIDMMTINVVEKYLSVSPSMFSWDFEDVDEDGMIHDSFKVTNRAHEIYSGGYVLNWSIIKDNLQWGTDWTFEPSSGSLPPNSSQTVEISLIPPEKGDYYGDNKSSIIVVNDNDTTENKTINFSLFYGLIELFPEYPITLYMDTAGTRTLENVFWVHKTRWEKNDTVLKWEICENTVDSDDNITVTFLPDSGVIPNGQAPTAVDMLITASDDVYKGTVKVCRVNDSADNDTVNITIVVGASSQFDVDVVHDYERLYEHEKFIVNITNAETGEPVPGVTVTYESYHEGTIYEINVTDQDGSAGFTAIDVPEDGGFVVCNIHVESIGYDSFDKIIWTHDSSVNIHGFVKDAITGDGIVGALVEAQPGGNNFTTVNRNGQYRLWLSTGTYNITASKDGYESKTSENVVVERDDHVWIDFDLIPDNYPPVADAGPITSLHYYSGYVDDAISFDGSDSYDPDGTIDQYDWEWYTGDPWEENIGPTPTHIFTEPGRHTVSVKVHDNEGKTDEDGATIILSKDLKIEAPNSINENEEFDVVVKKRDGSGVLFAWVEFMGETKYAVLGKTSFIAPGVIHDVDKLIHAYKTIGDSEAFRYITVLDTD